MGLINTLNRMNFLKLLNWLKCVKAEYSKSSSSNKVHTVSVYHDFPLQKKYSQPGR